MPRSRYGATDCRTGPTIVNEIDSRISCGIPMIVNAMTLGMKNWIGVRMAAGRSNHPTNRSARAGSRRYRLS